MKLRAYCPNICSELWVQSPPLLCNLLRPLCLFAAAAVHWPGTVPCPTGDRPKQPCDGRRRQLFQRPLFAYLTFSYFVRSIVLLAGFSTALQWWQYYALRGIHECDLDLQIRHRSPQKSPPAKKKKQKQKSPRNYHHQLCLSKLTKWWLNWAVIQVSAPFYCIKLSRRGTAQKIELMQKAPPSSILDQWHQRHLFNGTIPIVNTQFQVGLGCNRADQLGQIV